MFDRPAPGCCTSSSVPWPWATSLNVSGPPVALCADHGGLHWPEPGGRPLWPGAHREEGQQRGPEAFGPRHSRHDDRRPRWLHGGCVGAGWGRACQGGEGAGERRRHPSCAPLPDGCTPQALAAAEARRPLRLLSAPSPRPHTYTGTHQAQTHPHGMVCLLMPPPPPLHTHRSSTCWHSAPSAMRWAWASSWACARPAACKRTLLPLARRLAWCVRGCSGAEQGGGSRGKRWHPLAARLLKRRGCQQARPLRV